MASVPPCTLTNGLVFAPFLAVGERDGPPQNHPRCVERVYPPIHPRRRPQVSNTAAPFLCPCEVEVLHLFHRFVFLLLFCCSTLDDVLLSYITGVLEDLGSQQSVEENFDVEVFAEMLEAYIPGFAEIDR